MTPDEPSRLGQKYAYMYLAQQEQERAAGESTGKSTAKCTGMRKDHLHPFDNMPER